MEFASKYLKKILTETVPNKDVVSVINNLKKLNCKIILITARNDLEINGMYEFTEQWLVKNSINFDKLIVNCSDKLKACVDNDIELFVDDNYFTCKSIVDSKKIKVLLYETNYNKKYNDLSLKRVKNWKEILNIIIKMLNKEDK